MLRPVPILENRLTWSKSRGDTFAGCLRRYWWTYYGSWGGWASDAPAEAREAYLLKNLHSRWTWVGDVVHRTIARVLERILAEAQGDSWLALGGPGRPGDDAEGETTAMTAGMRAEWRDSRDGRYRLDPKRVTGLMEHEYALPVPDSEWREMHGRAVAGVKSFLASETFARIRESDPLAWFPIESLDSFDFEGTPIWAALDFGRRTPDGAEVYDWKTGEDRPEENRLQILCYALYVEAKHGIPATQVVGRLVYVNTGTVVEVRPTPGDLDDARAKIRASIGEMRRRIQAASHDGGEPNRLAFPMTDDLPRCAFCSFRRLCGR